MSDPGAEVLVGAVFPAQGHPGPGRDRRVLEGAADRRGGSRFPGSRARGRLGNPWSEAA